MQTFLQSVYFFTSLFSILLSAFLILAHKKLTLHRIFFYLGQYMLFIGIIPLLQLLAFLTFPRTISLKFIISIQMIGAASGYATIRLTNAIKENTINKPFRITAFTIMSLMVSVPIVDLCTHTQLLFSIVSYGVVVSPIMKRIIFPSSIMGLFLGCIFLWRSYLPQKNKNKTLLRPVIIGITILSIFDLYSILDMYRPNNSGLVGIIVLSAGIIQFLIFVFIFIIKCVKQNMLYNLHKKPKQINENLSSEFSESLYKDIKDVIANRELFRLPNFTIEKLAHTMDVSKIIISKVIHEFYGNNFNTFINSFRVEHMKQLLRNDKDSSIMELAIETGFSSRTSLNRIFHQHTGMSPKAYRDSLTDKVWRNK